MDEHSIRSVLQILGSQKIRRSGHNVMGTCPLAPYTHASGQDKNPSFTMKVNPGGDSPWHCFACQQSGTAKGLIYKIKEAGGGFNDEAYRVIKLEMDGSLGAMFGKLGSWDDQRKKKTTGVAVGMDWVVEGYEANFDIKDFEHMLQTVPKYVINRGVTIEQTNRWQLGFDKERQRLFIPIFSEDGKMIGHSARALYPEQEPKYMHAENMRRDKYLYGEHLVDKTNRLGGIVEGFMDVWALERFGLGNCLATMGVGCSYLHVDKLAKWFDTVMIFPHNDPPGQDGRSPGDVMASEYGERLKDKGVKVLVAPKVEGKKDPGDWTADDFMWVFGILKKQMEATK